MKIMGEARKIASTANGQSKKQKRGHPRGTEGAKNSPFFAALMDICHIKNADLEPKFQKNTNAGLCSEVTL